MKRKLNRTDYTILKSLAEYRIVTVKQISALYQSNKTAMSKKMKAFKKAGLAEKLRATLGHNLGRPEELIHLTERGFDVLKEQSIIHPSISYDAVSGADIHCANHQLLMNWFRIHLEQIQRVLPRLSYQIFTDKSPFLPLDLDMRPVLTEYVPSAHKKGEMVKFVPDAVVASKDAKTGTSLLFFLEVDMGTETSASLDRQPGDVREKILNYQAYFKTDRYKRYEKVWGCHFNGFRLLFLTHTPSRLRLLCNLTQQMPPADFVWLTEQSRMFSKGVADNIWARGGNLSRPAESILGSLCCHPPRPNIL